MAFAEVSQQKASEVEICLDAYFPLGRGPLIVLIFAHGMQSHDRPAAQVLKYS